MLAVQLPAGAQTWVAAGTDSAWTLGEHLTASVFDALNLANWQRSGDSKAKAPKPIPRPSDAREADVKADRLEARALAFKARQEARQATQQRKPKSRPRGTDGRFIKEA